MRFANVSICSVAHVDAPYRVSSTDLENRLAAPMQRLGLPPGILETLTGIKARRMWPASVSPSDAATLAARRAIAESGVDPERIGVLISTSVCRDFVEPSTACLVHGKLGLPPTCLNFDVGNACLGFINGMDIIGNMIERGQLDYGIVVDGEDSRYVIDKTIERLSAPDSTREDFWSNFATLTLGGTAAAMVLARTDLAQALAEKRAEGGYSHQFLGSVIVAATQHSGLCRGQVDRMETDSAELLTAGLRVAKEAWRAAQREFGWTPGALDECVIHQVSRTHTDKFCETFELDPAKLLATYPEFGNVGPAGVPMVLSKAASSGRLGRGDRVGLMGIGSGLNCAMAEVVW
ncbi:3-oxoacyl-(acyl carrier protein) synthase [Plesiocystis pacifica SIR-1]|uniref:3-oxoacyl-(Acyl carrier protein) synthase n=1 Tax=Plesiocystis pacifica SIR-1 TaxID=391625 RepID=A6G0Q4_9BACT|nr:3-oxoacyl-ACP synthase III [Plesiocystis pacifica]EDM80442.1 3-oxoacyl-(acyl carrier protein) synthase [Plesiocystis pacifica SIR-1]